MPQNNQYINAPEIIKPYESVAPSSSHVSFVIFEFSRGHLRNTCTSVSSLKSVRKRVLNVRNGQHHFETSM